MVMDSQDLKNHLEDKIWNYAYLNSGLTLKFNNKKYFSKNGLLDLLEKHIDICLVVRTGQFLMK